MVPSARSTLSRTNQTLAKWTAREKKTLPFHFPFSSTFLGHLFLVILSSDVCTFYL